MAINFPDSPISGTVFTVGDRTWTYDGAKWLSLSTTQVVPADAGRNAIINGAFDIWQRGTSSSSGYLADRWTFDNVGGGTQTQSQQTFTPGTAPNDNKYFYRIAITTASAYQSLVTKIEDVQQFAGQTVTLSFWAKAATAGQTISGIYLDQVFGTGGSSAVTATLSSNPSSLITSWARYAYTVTLPSISGKTIGAGSYLQLRYVINGTGTTDLSGVQLEAGSSATAFKRNAPSLQAELAACQRYYWRQAPGAITAIAGQTVAVIATEAYGDIQFPVQMRVPPLSVEYSNLQLNNNGQGQVTINNFFGISPTRDRSAYGVVTPASLVAQRAYTVITSSTAGFLGFSAEL